MATVAELLVKISAKAQGLQKELSAAQRQIKKTFGAEAMAASQDASMALTGVAAAITAAGAAALRSAAGWAVAVNNIEDITGMSGQAASKLMAVGQMVGLTSEDMGQALVKMSKTAEAAFESIKENGANSTDPFTRFGIAIMDSNGEMLSAEQIYANVAARHREMANGVEKTAMELAIFGKSGAKLNDLLNLTEEQMGTLTATAERMGLVISSEQSQAWENATFELNRAKLGFTALGNAAFQEVLPALSSAASGVATFMAQFAVVTKEQGITTALRNLIPKELQLGIFAISGALTAMAIPTMKLWGITAAKAALATVTAFGPAIAAGLAIGAVAYVIWAAWEPLSELMVSAWDSITDALQNAWDACVDKTTKSIDMIMDFIAPIVPYVTAAWDTISGWALQAWDYIVGIIKSAVGKILDFISPLTNLIGKVWDSVGVKTDEVRASIANVGSALDKVAGAAGVTGAALGAGAKGAKKAYDELAKEAERTSKEIYREWLHLTNTQQQQLDAWYNDELEKLNKSAAANENYDRDVTRLREIYAEKRRKIAADEAAASTAIFREARDRMTAMGNVKASIGLEGVQKEKFDIDTGFKDQVTKIGDYYDDLTAKFAAGTQQQKDDFIKQWQAAGVAFKINEQGMVDFSAQKKAEQLAAEGKYLQDVANLRMEYRQHEFELEEARKTGNIERFMAELSEGRALMAQDLAGRQEYISAFYQIWQDTHRSSMSYMAEAMMTFYNGATNALTDIFTGAKSASEAFQELGKSILKMLAQWVAQQIAGQLAMAIFGKSILQGQVAASTAAAAKVAAAWSGAAAAVSLASFGANSGPAMAGMAAAYGLSMALAIPKLASGGITTGPTLAEIGEGRYKEAVLPLNRRQFEKMGLTGGGGNTNHVQQNIYGDINTKVDYEEMMDDLGEMVKYAALSPG